MTFIFRTQSEQHTVQEVVASCKNIASLFGFPHKFTQVTGTIICKSPRDYQMLQTVVMVISRIRYLQELNFSPIPICKG